MTHVTLVVDGDTVLDDEFPTMIDVSRARDSFSQPYLLTRDRVDESALGQDMESVLIRYGVGLHLAADDGMGGKCVADRGDLSSDLAAVVVYFPFAELACLRAVAEAARESVRPGSSIDTLVRLRQTLAIAGYGS